MFSALNREWTAPPQVKVVRINTCDLIPMVIAEHIETGWDLVHHYFDPYMPYSSVAIFKMESK